MCNGFQVLCEAGLLPGALLLNASQKFICKDVYLKAENRTSFWMQGVDKVIRIPIAHGEGRYIADPETLAKLDGTWKDVNWVAEPYKEGSDVMLLKLGEELAVDVDPLSAV